MIRAVVFDLDGVLRNFDATSLAEIEHRHGLDSGVIEATAFAHPLLYQVTTGQIRRSDWVTQVGLIVGSPAAAQEWGAQTSMPDPEVLALTDELRGQGNTVAILTNGTDTIDAELKAQGIWDHVDHVFNSAVIGYAKPDRRAFEFVLDALELDGPEVFFTDDSFAKLEGARSLGMTTHHFSDVRKLRHALTLAGSLMPLG